MHGVEGGVKGVMVRGGAVLEVQEHDEPGAGCDKTLVHPGQIVGHAASSIDT